MYRPNAISEVISEKAAKELSVILRETFTSYVEHRGTMAVEDWLNMYLNIKLTDRTVEEINEISSLILQTIDFHDSQISEMNEAVRNGVSAQSWFAKAVFDSDERAGEQAKRLVECSASLTEISNLYEDEEKQIEVLDVEVIPQEEWEDEKWNSYRLKDVLIETVSEAGKVALMNTADDLYSKAMENGFQSVLLDKTIITESMLYGADSGLKVATAGALQIAADRSIIAQLPRETCPDVLANLAGLAIENVRVLGCIGKGEIDFSEGLSMIQNNTVATVAGMFGQKQGASIGAAIGTVLGPVGTLVGGFIGGTVGKFVGTKVGQTVVNAGKKICSAAKSVVKSVGSTLRRIGNTIKSLIR